jgi:hypothetical protein
VAEDFIQLKRHGEPEEESVTTAAPQGTGLGELRGCNIGAWCYR